VYQLRVIQCSTIIAFRVKTVNKPLLERLPKCSVFQA